MKKMLAKNMTIDFSQELLNDYPLVFERVKKRYPNKIDLEHATEEYLYDMGISIIAEAFYKKGKNNPYYLPVVRFQDENLINQQQNDVHPYSEPTTFKEARKNALRYATNTIQEFLVYYPTFDVS